jgi:hypothetical protein
MAKQLRAVWVYALFLAFVILLILAMKSPQESLKMSCKADIKWEDYSCVINGDEYVSCPHPTHVDCSGDIPLSMIERMRV